MTGARRVLGLVLAVGVLARHGPAAAAEGCLVFPQEPAPAAAPLGETVEGRPVLRHVPPHPKGIVYLFHGTGGSERFALRPQTVRALAPLVASGYAWAAAPSADRTGRLRWRIDEASPAANADIAYMLALHRALIGKGEITASTPVFTMGMSNGGAFANLFAAVAKREGLPMAAVADYMGPFPAAMRPLVSDPKMLAPTFVVVSRNDGLVDTDRVTAFAAEMAAGGARVETHLNVERPVCAETFAVVPGLAPAARETLVSRTLPAAGVIDGAGRRTVFTDHKGITPADMEALRSKLETTPGGAREGREVANTLLVAWAAHEMRSDWADSQRAFFEAALGRGR